MFSAAVVQAAVVIVCRQLLLAPAARSFAHGSCVSSRAERRELAFTRPVSSMIDRLMNLLSKSVLLLLLFRNLCRQVIMYPCSLALADGEEERATVSVIYLN